MARGQAAAANNQLKLTNSAGEQYQNNASSLLPGLEGDAEALTKSTGYDPETMSAITGAGMGATNAAFGSAAGQVNRTAAKTGNTASTAPALDQLARNKGQAQGQEAGDIQIQNANYANSQRMAGLNMLNNIYGTNVSASNQAYGYGPSTLQARAAGQSGDQLAQGYLGALVPNGLQNKG